MSNEHEDSTNPIVLKAIEDKGEICGVTRQVGSTVFVCIEKPHGSDGVYHEPMMDVKGSYSKANQHGFENKYPYRNL